MFKINGNLILGTLLTALLSATVLRAADETKLPTIPDEPKTIDPVTWMPESLAKRVTVDLSDSSLREMVDWLQEEQGIVALLDIGALDAIGMLPSQPVSDRLDDTPIYLLLNRLRMLDLDWYIEDDIVHITTAEKAEEQLLTASCNVSDLIDAGYDTESLIDLIETTIRPTTWDSVGGPGSLMGIGDVIFIRQVQCVQHEIRGLLKALRGHGRQTFLFDPSQHIPLRGRLEEPISVDFEGTPLVSAVRDVSEAAGVDIRLDYGSLDAMGIPSRQPVTLKLNDRKLSTVLKALLSEVMLTCVLKDGVIWITGRDVAEETLKTVIYDVRDLCSDEKESDALIEAIEMQAEPTSWDSVGGRGSIMFAKPGTMLVRQNEQILGQIFDLLQAYRTALTQSKRRDREKVDPEEIITVYYRLHTNVAEGLMVQLPQLVSSIVLNNGEMVLVPSVPEVSELPSGDATDDTQHLIIGRSILIITQTRAVHEEIAEVIDRVESGDAVKAVLGDEMMMPSMGGGMGGFGGDFFMVPPGKRKEGDRRQ